MQGVVIADLCAMRVYRQGALVQLNNTRERVGGLIAELPTSPHTSRTRLIRFAVAGALIVWAIVIFLLYDQHTILWYFGIPLSKTQFQASRVLQSLDQEGPIIALLSLQHALLKLIYKEPFWLSTAFLFGAAGCIHFDATLLAWLGRWPLVNTQSGYGRATYIGRHALIVPLKSVVQTITPEPEAAAASAALVALLREGCLGPLVRKACTKLSEQQIYTLLLHLSLHEGGASAIHYLEPILSPALRQVATQYANLAREAAKPLDLQRWIALLPRDPDDPAISRFDHHTNRTLAHAREALLQIEDTPAMAKGCAEVQELVHTLNHPTKLQPLSWPIALLLRLEEQQHLLSAAVTTNSRGSV